MEQGINPAEYGVTPFTIGGLTAYDVELIIEHHHGDE